MILRQLAGLELPLPVNVYGWRWPRTDGDAQSERVFHAARRGLEQVKLADQAIGLYRSRADGAGPPLDAEAGWFVWVVDLGLGLEEAVPTLAEIVQEVDGERAEPDLALAEMLLVRHLRVIEGGEGQVAQWAHYGTRGVGIDETGRARPL